MRLLCAAVALLACAGTRAQDQDAIRAAMAPSIEKQKASVRQQVSTAGHAAAPTGATPAAGTPATPSFFTVDWPTPPNFAALLAAAPPDCEPLPQNDVQSLVDKAAKQEGVKPELIHAVMEQESGFKPCAMSPKGAQGLMQLMPSTADQFHVTDAFDPAENVSAGAKLLKMLLDKYNGDTRLALGAYNAGGARVDETGDIPAIPETQDYVTSIMNRLAKDATATKPVTEAPAAVPGP